MKHFRKIVSLALIVFLLVLVGQVNPASSEEPKIPKPGIKPEELHKPLPPPALAPVTNARIIECSGGTVGPARLVLVWSYGTGVKPEKVVIDVKRGSEGSVLIPKGTLVEVSGTETRKEVRIWRLYDVPYTLIFTAHYPPWGQRTYTFVKRCGD
jgi:hypothetical protein